MKPLIGITMGFDYNDEIGVVTGLGTPQQEWDYIATDYANAVIKAGGIPVLIPNCSDPEVITDFIQKIDGLLLSGGSDIDPEMYGEFPHGYCGHVFVRRDLQEKVALREAYNRRIPIFGICRGLQFMNVYFGGSLYQDLFHECNTPVHSSNVYRRNYPVHRVELMESTLKDIIGEDRIATNSFHHQGVKDAAPNARVVATAVDGVVEGMEFMGGHPFTLAVQWHPEMMYDSPITDKIFKAFVEACEQK